MRVAPYSKPIGISQPALQAAPNPIARAAARRAIPVAEASNRVTTPAPDDPKIDDDLVEALAALPVKQRQAVAYHYLGDLPYADIAVILGGSTAAARRAAADGIATLRRTYPGVTARNGEPR